MSVEIFINGKAFAAQPGSSIVEACRVAGVYVPTMCHHPRLKPIGKCGVCYVEIEGQKEGVLGCSTKVAAGMRIRTDTPTVKARAAQALQRLLTKVRARSGADVLGETREMSALQSWTQESSVDDSSHAVVIDASKCVECGRCTRACKELQGMGVIKVTDSSLQPVQPTAGRLADTDCISCGQCTSFCPTGAIHECSDFTPILEAIRAGKTLVAQTAPATRVAISEEFGRPTGDVGTAKMVGGLKAAGFQYVFDTNFTADLTIMEEGTELLGRIKKGGVFPMFTSCCPAWINLLEKCYPEFIPNVSSCKSPQAMLGRIIKTFWAKKMNKRPEDLYHVSVMPCCAKKDEILRPDLQFEGRPDIDYVMTTRELAAFMKLRGVTDWATVPEIHYDDPLAEGTGAAVIFGVTGGVMEAALRTAYEVHTGKRLPSVDFVQTRGFEGVKEATIDVDGLPVKIAVVHGIANVRKFLDGLKADPARGGYHFIEIMSCPCGCIGGGGQPKSAEPDTLQRRCDSIYALDEHATVRRSHENKSVMQLYKEWLHEPNSHIAHEHLHTHYHAHVHPVEHTEKPAEAAAAAGAEGQRSVAVLYGSQTGNAEGFARRLSNDLKSAKFDAKLYAMDEYPAGQLASEQLVCVVTSTFGEGERPDNAAAFWDALAGMSAGAISNVKFAVFGLGSSKYPKFCKAAKEFDEKLHALGGQRVIDAAFGDECADDGANASFEPWESALYDELGVEPPKVALVPHYRVVLSLQPSMPVPPPPKTMYARLTRNETITAPGYDRFIQFCEFDMTETGLSYQVGDALGIHPSNPLAAVDAFLREYGVNGEAVISVVPVEESAPLPIIPCLTVRHLFERYLDCFAKPRKMFFRQLAQFATDPAQKQKLETMGGSSDEGKAMLLEYLKDFPAYTDVLRDFPSARPSLDFLVEMIPLIKPRLYSVGSSPRASQGRLCQLVVAIPTEWARARRTIRGGGLCTTYLMGLDAAKRPLVPVCVTLGTLRPPKDSKAPMLMCGLGTGLAPMRALMQDRMVDNQEHKQTGTTTFYQACRHRSKDFVLQGEMDAFKRAGVLTTHIGAFSHDDKNRFETADLLMKEHPEDVWEIFQHPNAHYFYCGPAAYNIPQKLEDAMTRACAVAGHMTEEKAKEYIEKMKSEGRFVQEAF